MYIKRIDLDFGDRYYLRYNDNNDIIDVCSSVTTVINTYRNEGLDRYIKSAGAEALQKKADLGTAIHICIEHFLAGGIINYELLIHSIPNYYNGRFYPNETEEAFDKLARLLNYIQDNGLHNNKFETEKCAIGLIDDRCLVAGTIDYYDIDNNIIIDWKSGYARSSNNANLDLNYQLQLAIYSILIKQHYKLEEYPIAKIVMPKNTRVNLEYKEYTVDMNDVDAYINYVNLFVSAYKYGGFGNEADKLKSTKKIKDGLEFKIGSIPTAKKDLYNNYFDLHNKGGLNG